MDVVEAELKEEDATSGLGWGLIDHTDKERKARHLFEERAHLLSAPADPEILMWEKA